MKIHTIRWCTQRFAVGFAFTCLAFLSCTQGATTRYYLDYYLNLICPIDGLADLGDSDGEHHLFSQHCPGTVTCDYPHTHYNRDPGVNRGFSRLHTADPLF